MPETIISDQIKPNGHVYTVTWPATVEAVAGGRYNWTANLPKTLPAAFDDLTQDFGDDIYDRMLFDPQVSACLATLKTAILSDGVAVTPAIIDAEVPGYKKATAIADFIRQDLENLTPTIDNTLWALLDGMAYGSRVAEQTYRLADNRLHLGSIKVKPRTVTAYVVDAFNNVLGLLAAIPGLSASPVSYGSLMPDPQLLPNFLPRDKFVLYTSWPRDADPRGTSILRPAYKPWWDKQQMKPEYLKYLTQFASASIIATAPESNVPFTTDASADAPPNIVQQIAAALEGFRNGTFVVLPFGANAKAIEVAGEGIPFMHAFDRFDREISTAILHQTLATQESRHETRAAAEVHQDILALLVRMGKRAIAQMLKQDVFQPLVRYNWGDQAALDFCPTPNLSTVEAEDLSPRMNAVAQMADKGMIFPSQLPEIFADLDLPEASPEDLAAYAKQFHAPPPPPPQVGAAPGTGSTTSAPVSGEPRPPAKPPAPASEEEAS
jgi:hypothetical protein